MLPLFICPYLYTVLSVPLMALTVLLNTAASNVKMLRKGVWVALAQNPPLASHLAQVKTVTQRWSARPHMTSNSLASCSLTRSLPSACQEDSTLPSSFTTEVNLVSGLCTCHSCDEGDDMKETWKVFPIKSTITTTYMAPPITCYKIKTFFQIID